MKNLEFTGFPVSNSEFSTDLQVLVKQIHARYTSRVTVVLILPQGIWAAKKIEDLAAEEGLLIHLVGLGIIPVERDGKKGFSIIEPPSHHSIFGKKVVIIGAAESPDMLLAAGSYIRNMRPQSIEIGSIISYGELPVWMNPDYVVYQVPPNLIVTGLGFGYTPEEASGGALTATEVLQDTPPEVTSTEKTEEIDNVISS